MNGFYYQIDQLFAEKRIAEAETYMKDMLAEAEKSQDLGAIITIANELGGYYRAVSRYSEGIPLYEKALSCIEQLGLTGNEHHGTTLINYATTYTMTGDQQKALQLYQQAAEIFGAGGYALDYRLATLYNNMSYICQDLGQTSQAEEYLNHALYILKTLDDSEIEVAITYTNLAGLYLSMGPDHLDEAKLTVKKALDLFIGESGDTDVHYAAAVSMLGNIYYQEAAYDKALALFDQALSLTRRDYGEDTASYATVCENIAQCYRKLGQEPQAKPYEEKAAEIKERIQL
ncbi:MAG: tetratricopeptide repeat protein [Firmicutes bacterium]|nr:tetratricopeptide repeat protein [Bacillota bacterium]